jgi:hypothetical protein
MPTRKFSNWSDRVMPIGSTGVLGGKNQSNNIVMRQLKVVDGDENCSKIHFLVNNQANVHLRGFN